MESGLSRIRLDMNGNWKLRCQPPLVQATTVKLRTLNTHEHQSGFAEKNNMIPWLFIRCAVKMSWPHRTDASERSEVQRLLLIKNKSTEFAMVCEWYCLLCWAMTGQNAWILSEPPNIYIEILLRMVRRKFSGDNDGTNEAGQALSP